MVPWEIWEEKRGVRSLEDGFEGRRLLCIVAAEEMFWARRWRGDGEAWRGRIFQETGRGACMRTFCLIEVEVEGWDRA
jgi:hypothetical protein